ncbi:transposase [Candidatus Magnetomoraceae bacterium gMMP-15]
MKKLLSPKLDFVFKKLFTKDVDLLIDLINTVLKLSDYKRVKEIEIKNPTILPEDISKKFIVLDILAVDETDHKYDIEIQVRKYDYYPERALYYLTKMYSDQLDSGEKYDELKPVIGIHFLDYKQFPKSNQCYFCFQLRDVDNPKLKFTDDLSLIIFELPKLSELKKLDKTDKYLMEWLYFLKHADKEGDKNMRTHYTNPSIHKAFNILEGLSSDEEVRIHAQMRERALRDELSMLASARREGEKIGIEKGEKIGEKKSRKAIAKNLLLIEQLSIDEIARITGLNKDELRALS